MRRSHRPLDAAQGIALDQVVEARQRDQHLVGDRGEPLAQRRRLRRHVVRASGHHERRVLGGQLAEPRQGGDHPHPHQLQRLPDLQLLDVLGQVAAGHALVDVFLAGQRTELLDPRLHVVAGDPLTSGDRFQIDLVDHCFVRSDRRLWDVDSELALRLHHRDPELPLRDHLVLGRPEVTQLSRRVAPGQDIGDRGHRPQYPAHVQAESAAARWAMSVRDWAPSKEISSTPLYARSRASASESPTAVTASTRPPLVSTLRGVVGGERRPGVMDEDTLDRRLPRRDRRSGRPCAERPDSRRRPSPRSRRRLDFHRRARSCRGIRSRRHTAVHRAAGRAAPASGSVSGSPKRALNSITRVPLLVRASPAYRRPTNGMPRRASSSIAGCRTVASDFLDQSFGRPRQRRVRTHASSVGTLVAITESLEVLRRLHREHRRAVTDPEQRDLGAIQELLDHHPLARCGMREGGGAIRGDHDALARGQSVVLDDVRRTEVIQRRSCLVGIVADVRTRRRDAGGGHDLFGERLRTLDRSRLAVGPEYREIP